jgi:hypothetical protein
MTPPRAGVRARAGTRPPLAPHGVPVPDYSPRPVVRCVCGGGEASRAAPARTGARGGNYGRASMYYSITSIERCILASRSETRGGRSPGAVPVSRGGGKHGGKLGTECAPPGFRRVRFGLRLSCVVRVYVV